MTLISNFKKIFSAENSPATSSPTPPSSSDLASNYPNTSSNQNNNQNNNTSSNQNNTFAKLNTFATPVSGDVDFAISPSPSSSMSSSHPYSDLPSHYHLLHPLGEGAFSKVYKAIDKRSHQPVAIKIINKINLSTKQLFNIKNEINIMSKISHLNLLKLYHAYNAPQSDYCYLILEYCDGGEIFNKIIEYTYFSEVLSRHVFVQLLDAINHLHQNNIVHRDIKPENLLFQSIPFVPRSSDIFKHNLRQSDDESKIDEGHFTPGVGGGTIGVIKLADFGLAKQLKSDDGLNHFHLKTPCGTAGYTAPEVITCNISSSSNTPVKRHFKNSMSKQNHYSKSVDIWSLGCFLYTILCGFPPFYDDDQHHLSSKILRGDYVFLKPWWDEIGSDVQHLISRMLDINPESRITIEEIYNHPWITKTKEYSQQSQYFNLSTTLKSPVYSSEHLEYRASSTSQSPSISNSPSAAASPYLSSHQHPHNPALLSPRAEAIKRVFNNPAMSNNASVQFFENIDEREDDSDINNDSSRSPSPGQKLPSQQQSHSNNETPTDKLGKVNFKNVFDNSINVYQDEDEDEDEDEEQQEQVDEITSLALKQTDSSSNSSLNSETENDEDYQTRSSSIISGLNGDFKFTLSLNDSHLLTRRKSSSVTRHTSLNKSRNSSLNHSSQQHQNQQHQSSNCHGAVQSPALPHQTSANNIVS